jgi:hypothetical protein
VNAGLYVHNGPSRRKPAPVPDPWGGLFTPPRRSVVGQILDGFSAVSLDSELIVIVIAIALMLAFTAAMIFVP